MFKKYIRLFFSIILFRDVFIVPDCPGVGVVMIVDVVVRDEGRVLLIQPVQIILHHSGGQLLPGPAQLLHQDRHQTQDDGQQPADGAVDDDTVRGRHKVN